MQCRPLFYSLKAVPGGGGGENEDMVLDIFELGPDEDMVNIVFLDGLSLLDTYKRMLTRACCSRTAGAGRRVSL